VFGGRKEPDRRFVGLERFHAKHVAFPEHVTHAPTCDGEFDGEEM
jgi:hypothetical protein